MDLKVFKMRNNRDSRTKLLLKNIEEVMETDVITILGKSTQYLIKNFTPSKLKSFLKNEPYSPHLYSLLCKHLVECESIEAFEFCIVFRDKMEE